jgi:hypothetical protein
LFFFNASRELLRHYQVYLAFNKRKFNVKEEEVLSNNEILNRVSILKEDFNLDETSKQNVEEVKYV